MARAEPLCFSWLRMDANWISLYPEGGDVEVEMMQVTRVE
jgi:hypothetical protein